MYSRKVLMQLFAGLALLVLGMFLFVSRVSVSTGMGYRLGGYQLSGGLIVLPLILSLIWLVVKYESIWPKFATGVSLAFIILAIVANTRFYFTNESLFNYLIMLAMIAIGVGLIIKVGLSDPRR